jgi:hypothetical protein
MFKDCIHAWCHNHLNTILHIPVNALRQRLAVFQLAVNVAPDIVAKIENAIKYIERHQEDYVGISAIF